MNHKSIILSAALAVLPAGFASATAPVFLDEGHLDIVFSFNGTAWHTEVNFEETASYPVENTVFVAKDAPLPDGSRFPRSSGAEWDFIGVSAGEDYWFFPSSPVEGILGPGFDTAPPSGVNYADVIAQTIITDPRAPGAGNPRRYIIIELLRYRYYGDGAGHVSMWIPDAVPIVYWSTYAEPADGNVWYNLAGNHDHMNWGFSDRGVYKLELQARTQLLNGTTSYSPVTTVTVAVGVPEWSSPYGMWRYFNFTETQISEGLADPDVAPAGGGVTNEVSYSLGLDPFTANQADLPQLVSLPDNQQGYAFTVNPDATSIEFSVERSSDLVDWTTVASAIGGQPFNVLLPNWDLSYEVLPDGRVEVTVDIPQPTAGAEPGREFLRLRLED